MVAIVLAGSIVFWLIGVHPVSGDEQLPRWTRWLMLALIILTLLLTAVLEAYHVLGWWNPQ
jgi:type VI protein secretion system component VasK